MGWEIGLPPSVMSTLSIWSDQLGVPEEDLGLYILLGVLIVIIPLYIGFRRRRLRKEKEKLGLGIEVAERELAGVSEEIAVKMSEREAGEFIERILEFPAEKVKVESHIDKITLKFVKPEPEVVEKIVEVPVEKVVEKVVEVPVEKVVEKPAAEPLQIVKQIDLGKAKDLSSGIKMMVEKYGLDSVTLADDKGEVIGSTISKAKAKKDAAKVTTLLSKAKPKEKRIEGVFIYGEEFEYLNNIPYKDISVMSFIKTKNAINETTFSAILDDLNTVLGLMPSK
jgi:hypothetical protein